mgnify:FL=1
METTEADRIVMEECGLLSEQQRARLGYRTVKGVRKAEQFLLSQGVPGVSKTIKQSSDPLQGMLALRRSAKQFQTTSMFNPNELVDPSLYAFRIRYPVERLRQRFLNMALTITGNEDPAEFVAEIQETLDLELNEAQAMQLMEAKIKDLGDTFVNKMVNMVDILRRGDIQGALRGMVSLIDEARLIKSRKVADEATFVGQNNQLIEETLEAETAQTDAEYNARLEGAPIKGLGGQKQGFNTNDLVRAYREKIGDTYGANRKTATLQRDGLVGFTVFGKLTRREKIAMVRVAYGDSPDARGNLLRQLNLIVEDKVKVETEGETRVNTNLIEAVEEDVGLVAE